MRIALPGSSRPARARMSALAVIVLGAAGTGTVLVGSGEAASDYRVDVIFDSAKGVIPGQTVKIAGAKAGTINDAVLTKDYKARLQLSVDAKFAPFRSNAKCQILAEGLIAERFVQCDPGTAAGTPLRAEGGNAPTVPVENTFVPVNFTDLFNIWRLPVRQRLATVFASLGLGLAGKGDELNDLLRRANPTLALLRQAISILNRQRSQLSSIIVQSDRLAAELAPRSSRVRAFITQADRVTKQTADHDAALSEAVRRLPGLLDATEPALKRLDEVAANGTPVLRDLRASAPGLRRAIAELVPFSKVGTPAIKQVGDAAAAARPEIRRLRPIVAQLRDFAREGLPTGKLVDELFVNLRDRGFVEGLLKMVTGFAAVSARKDAVSHVPTLTAIVQASCILYSPVETPPCNGKYNSTAPAVARANTPGRQGSRNGNAPAPAPALAVPGAPATTAPSEIRVPGLPPIKLPAVPKLGGQGRSGSASSSRQDRNAVRNLLDYLLG